MQESNLLRTPHRSRNAPGAAGVWRTRDAGGNRTHFDRVAAGCLAIQLQRRVSSSGVEPDPRPSQGRVRSATPRGYKSIPARIRTGIQTLGKSDVVRYTTRTNQSRRLDSHQHGPVYETGAFLFRATSARAGAHRFELCRAALETACSPRSTLL
jgi:hypothetical protein